MIAVDAGIGRLKMSNTVNTKLQLIELMESLGAKPQAEGDFIFWELDSKDFKEQASSDKPQGSSDKQKD